MPKEIHVGPDFKKGELSFSPIPLFQYHKNLGDELKHGLNKQEALTHFELMLLVRHFEQLIVDMKSNKYSPREGFKFIGATHLSLGQEAVAVGAISALRPNDYITSSHRGHGHSIVKTAIALRSKTEDELNNLLSEAAPYQFDGEDIHEKILNLHLFRTMAQLFGKQDG
jgi:2-oxoisovalerate dehydrogenase E1 component